MSRPQTHIEALLTADQRRPSSVERQIAFRESISTPRELDDIDDELAGDPLIERHANRRKASKAKGVLDILDQLERERSKA